MRSRSLPVAIVATAFACSKTEAPRAPDASVPPPSVAEASPPKRPPLPGDVKHGWELFREHCTGCHGASRRGTGPASDRLPTPPADLRDPLLLAQRTNAELADVILHGVAARPADKSGAPARKEMPGFASEVGEQGAMDLVAFLRGDSIHLEECFADATHYVRVAVKLSGPPLYAAYAAGAPGGGPRVLRQRSELPPNATLRGYVSFAELDLPGAGPTPIALVARPDGRIAGVRVALPEPDNVLASRDIEAVLERGAEGAPKLRPTAAAIAALGQWLGEATRQLE